MSSDSGGSSQKSTPPCDIPGQGTINAEQETEKEVGNSELAMSENESLFPALYQSLPSSFPASLVSTVLPPPTHLWSDNQEHQNEDATRYSTSSPRNNSQEDANDQLTAGVIQTQPSSNEEDLPLPHQATETDNTLYEMVVTNDYTSESLISTYCLIQKRAGTTVEPIDNPGDQNVDHAPPNDNTDCDSIDATPLFHMDDDLPSQDDKDQGFLTAHSFTDKLSLSFGNEQSAVETVPDPSGANGSEKIKAELPASYNQTTHSPSESNASQLSDTSSDESPTGQLIYNAIAIFISSL